MKPNAQVFLAFFQSEVIGMGLFDRFFSSDPSKEIQKIEGLLNDGDNEKALKLAQRLEKKNPAMQEAQVLLAKSLDAMACGFLEKASRSESAGALSDAADWIEIALDYVPQEEKRTALKEKINLLRQQDEENSEPESAVGPAKAKKPVAVEDHDVDEEIHYVTLIGMLAPEVASLYEERDAQFRAAYIALNSGDAEQARIGFEALLQENQNDPVLRLERARCALILEDPEVAQADLEIAWPSLGDEPLDLAGSISVPYLWGHAMMKMKKTLAIVDRLGEQARPSNDFPGLSLMYATALEQSEMYEPAVKFLVEAVKKFETMPDFPYLLAIVFDRQGDWEQAIHCLEGAIAPSCAVGCAAPPKHLPSLRLLTSLYLSNNHQPKRAKELLTFIAQTTNGQLRREDYLLLAEYHKQMDDLDAEAHARAQADEALEASQEEETITISGPQQSEKAVL